MGQKLRINKKSSVTPYQGGVGSGDDRAVRANPVLVSLDGSIWGGRSTRKLRFFGVFLCPSWWTYTLG